MGFDLRGHGEFRYGISGWPNILELALKNGWNPMGTQVDDDRYPDGLGWPGTYGTNDRQWVRPEDAAGMADALEVAVQSMPDKVSDLFGETRNTEIDRTGEFIKFLRGGGFSIC